MGKSNCRRWGKTIDVGHTGQRVAAALGAEQPRLLPLPEHPFPCDLVRAVRSGKTPYVVRVR
jgi:hypothetical protein